MTDDRTPKQPPVKQGDEVGWLTIVEWRPTRSKCQCRCGEFCLRDNGHLGKARLHAQEPKCKKCEREVRKRKNPGAIAYASPVWYR